MKNYLFLAVLVMGFQASAFEQESIKSCVDYAYSSSGLNKTRDEARKYEAKGSSLLLVASVR